LWTRAEDQKFGKLVDEKSGQEADLSSKLLRSSRNEGAIEEIVAWKQAPLLQDRLEEREDSSSPVTPIDCYKNFKAGD